MSKSKVFTKPILLILLLVITSVGMLNSTTSAQTYPAEIKFMTYNIEASGEDPAWKDVIKEENADIIAFIETGIWDDNNNELLDEYCQEFNNYFDGEDSYQCEGTEGIGFDTSGEAIFSRFPIQFTNQIAEVTLDDGSSYDVSHDFLHAAIEIENSTLNVIASHLKCCGGSENEEKREKQQEGIINYMDELGDVPLIYTGDLNSFSPVDTENQGDLNDGPVSMLLETNGYQDRASEIHQFVDVFRELNPSDPGFTYGHQNSQYQSRIDFVFANQYVSDDSISSTVGDTSSADEGSDHYSVDTVLQYDPEDSNGNRYTGEVSTPAAVGFNLILPVLISLSITLLIKKTRCR